MALATEQANNFSIARRLGKWYRARADGDPDHPVTHTMQNGGVLSVPDGELDKLYTALGEDLAGDPQCRFFVSEQRTPVFPMYYDVDLGKDAAEARKEAYALVVRAAREDVRSFFRGATEARQFDAVVCTVGDDFSGVHVYFPRLLVDKDRAELIRFSLVARLQHEARDLVGNWEAVVDEGVYRFGLRMPGARKLVECTQCKAVRGAPDPNCPGMCDRRGRQCVDRQYRFFALFSDVEDAKTDAHREALRTNWTYLLQQTSLRRPAGVPLTPGFAEYPGCPRPSTAKLRFPKKNELPRSSPAWPMIERAVRRFAGEYYQLDVQRVFIPADNRYVMVFVSGKNATFCPNIKDYHRSARVWFKILQSGIELRCQCKCKKAEGRRPCSEYRSHTIPLDRELIDVLFPNNMFRRRDARACSTSAPATPVSPGSCATPLQLLQTMHRAARTAPETPALGMPDPNGMHALPAQVRRMSGNANQACLSLVQNLTSHLKVIEQAQRPPPKRARK